MLTAYFGSFLAWLALRTLKMNVIRPSETWDFFRWFGGKEAKTYFPNLYPRARIAQSV
jgi:hypothetical protein